MTEPGPGEFMPPMPTPEQQVPPAPHLIAKEGGAILHAADVEPDDTVRDAVTGYNDGQGAWPLPDEADDDWDEWLGSDEDNAARDLEGNMLDQFGGLPVHDPVDEATLQAWFDAKSPDEQARLLETRKYNDMILAAHESGERRALNGLEKSAPELLVGKLPADLAERMGDTPYILGVRQHGTHDDSVEQVTAMVERDGGLDLANQSLSQSMLFANQYSEDGEFYATQVMARGYYGSDVGRFVTALPIPEGMDRTAAHAEISVAYLAGDGPQDFERSVKQRDGRDIWAVNPKYIAGYIDSNGIFHKNAGFMVDDTPFDIRSPQPAASASSEWL